MLVVVRNMVEAVQPEHPGGRGISGGGDRIELPRREHISRIGRLQPRLAGEGGTQPLVIEDVERSGYAEPALFHLLNQSMRDRRPVLMTTREPIANWPFETDDLKSRARLAQRFTLALSDDIQLSQMFVKLFGDRQVAVDPKVIAYIVARMERSPEEAVALAETADRLALAHSTAITRRIAAMALAERGVAQLELDLEGDDDE